MQGKYSKWTRGEEEALLNRHGGEEKARAFIRGEFRLVPRDPTGLLQRIDYPIEFPAVPRFVGEDSFIKSNGIALMGNDFKKYIFPLVEENVAVATLTIFRLTCEARASRIHTELDVDVNGEVSLAHFFQALATRPLGICTDGLFNVAYIIGTDFQTWAVSACLRSDGWFIHAFRLGDRGRWCAGHRFLSR